MQENIITVLIVDDSAVSRELLRYIIEEDPQLKVIGVAESGEKALQFIQHQKPDVITMDIVMPYMDGFEVTRRIMETQPIPILIISGVYTADDVSKTFHSIEAGALAILEKPQGLGGDKYQAQAQEIRNAIKSIAEVKLMTRQNKTLPSSLQMCPLIEKNEFYPNAYKAVAIGSSLGGPQALYQIFSQLPADFPVPVYIVQHISDGFVQGLVNWLNTISALKIKVAEHRENALPGYAYIAPSKFQMEITPGNMLVLTEGCLNDFLKPSVACLFRSMAATYGKHGIGVLLTGMGKDGAEELLEMKNSGAYTIAQDEASSVLFGMPKEAIRLGAAQSILPLQQIAPTLEKLVGKNQGVL